jgi:hypothetical protein
MLTYNEQVQEDAVSFSEDLFGLSILSNYEQNYLDSSSQMPSPNYPQNYQREDQMLDLNYQQPPPPK